MKTTNQVIVAGRLAQDAEIRQFANSTKATFALAISRTEKRGEETVRPVAYQPCEIWRKNGSTDSFAQLTKGALVEITGWIRPEEFVDKTGKNSFFFYPLQYLSVLTCLSISTVLHATHSIVQWPPVCQRDYSRQSREAIAAPCHIVKGLTTDTAHRVCSAVQPSRLTIAQLPPTDS